MNGGLAAPRPAIVDLVFETAPRTPKRRRVPPAIALALLVHLALVVWALGSRPSLEIWGAEIAARVHAELNHVELVDIEPEPTPPPTPTPPPDEPPPPAEPPTLEPEAEPPPAPAPRPSAPAPGRTRSPAEAPPARAGEVLAAEGEAVDLTNTIAQGDASTYAGGVTSSRGAGDSPGGRGGGGATKPVTPTPTPSAPKQRPADDRSAPVSLAPERWSCPWPQRALDVDDDEAHVILKVSVDRRGRATEGVILSDPGHHFGEAALACALRTQFAPARDARGEAIGAWSPPIRVRFYR